MRIGNAAIAALMLGTAEVLRAYLGEGLAWEAEALPSEPFHPSQLFGTTDNGVFIDLSEPTSIWQDTAATLPVTAEGQSIARVNDLSGKGNHLVQATPANCPTYETSTGNPALLVTGSQTLGTASINGIMRRNNTLVTVQRHASGGGNATYVFIWTASGPTGTTN